MFFKLYPDPTVELSVKQAALRSFEAALSQISRHVLSSEDAKKVREWEELVVMARNAGY